MSFLNRLTAKNNISSYITFTKHPVTGRWAKALWIDDYFGRHHYGVRFPIVSSDIDLWNEINKRDIFEVFDPEQYRIATKS